MTIDPVYADAGVIYIHSATLTGTGTFIAPNSATVTIINNSLASLNLYGIQISADQGGLWYNIGPVSTNATINGINGGGTAANFNLSNVCANGPAATPPAIVDRKHAGHQHDHAAHGADIAVAIDNIALPGSGRHRDHQPERVAADRGLFRQALGNITLDGPVNVGTQTIITHGTLIITGVTDEEVGGAAYCTVERDHAGRLSGGGGLARPFGGIGPASAKRDQYVADDAVIVSRAQDCTAPRSPSMRSIIDIDGMIQSGNPEFDLTINPTVTAEIDTLSGAWLHRNHQSAGGVERRLHRGL